MKLAHNAAFGLGVVLLLSFLPAARADDVPYGFQQVKEKPAEGEVERIKTLNANKELVGRKILKADSTSELHHYAKDGMLTQKIVYDKNGERLAEFDYYLDGKLKRELKKGVLQFERRKLADGTFEAIRYKADGKRPQMRRRVGVDGAFELTHYRTGASNKVWFGATIRGASGNFEWQYFANDGSHLRRVLSGKEMVVTVFDEFGNYKLEQVWTKNEDGWHTIRSAAVKHNSGYRRYTVDEKGKLTVVDDLDSDGTVTSTWKADQVEKPDAKILEEQYEDDPTVPEKPDAP